MIETILVFCWGVGKYVEVIFQARRTKFNKIMPLLQTHRSYNMFTSIVSLNGLDANHTMSLRHHDTMITFSVAETYHGLARGTWAFARVRTTD